MRAVEWEEEWIKVAIKLAKEIWHKHYWPKHVEPKPQAEELSSKTALFGFSLFMDCLLSTVNNTATPLSSPVDKFVNGTPIFNIVDGKCTPFNLLVWWYGQQHCRNKENGLMQMSLDVLSCPVSSVDVECAFLFAGSLVLKHWHNLSPHTIQATATLGSYLKAGLMKPGTLKLLLRGKEKEKMDVDVTGKPVA